MDVTATRPGGTLRQGLHFPLREQRAYTLVEVLIRVAVAAIVFGTAAPGLHGVVVSNRLAGQVNRLVGDLALARSEAVKRNRDVVLCKSHDGESCIRSEGWHHGWIMFEDTNRNRVRDDDEPLLRVQQPFTAGSTLIYRAFGSRHYVTYRPSGVTLTNGTFTFCAAGQPQHARSIILHKTGRPRLSRTQPGGAALECS